jgi:benzoyl-CoA reductase/2-hydroxyglutaryl-CoA dehydratase subunit BcrC/BadD/HgdB
MYCPKCNRFKEASTILDRTSMRAKQLPFFECGSCGLAYIDRKLVRKILKEWKGSSLTDTPLRDLCEAATQTLEQHVKNLKLKPVQFNKNPP